MQYQQHADQHGKAGFRAGMIASQIPDGIADRYTQPGEDGPVYEAARW